MTESSIHKGDKYITECWQKISKALERGKAVQIRKKDLRRKFQREEQELDERIESGDGDVDELQEEKSSLETKALLDISREETLWERELLADIKPYAQATCLKTVTAFYFALPREVRDIVYNYIICSDQQFDRNVTVRDENLPHQPRAYCGRASVHGGQSFWKPDSYKHYMDPLYVGQEVTKEMAEMWYKSVTFYFDYHDLYLLHKFLNIDRFGYGIVPATFVKHLELVIDGNYGCSCNSKALFYVGLTSSDTMDPVEAVRWNLEQLLTLKTRSARITLVGYLKDGRSKLEECVAIMHIILPIVQQLEERGFQIPIRLHTNRNRVWNIEDSASRPIDQALREMREKYGEDYQNVGDEWIPEFNSHFSQA